MGILSDYESGSWGFALEGQVSCCLWGDKKVAPSPLPGVHCLEDAVAAAPSSHIKSPTSALYLAHTETREVAAAHTFVQQGW